MEAQQFRVVVVGGGYAGLAVIEKLESKKNIKVFLVDPKAAAYHAVGAPRALVDEAFAAKAFVPYSDALRKAEHVNGRVTAIRFGEKRIVVATGAGEERSLDYDVLVLASGRTYDSPFRLTAAGGGTVPELVAEVAEKRRLIGEAASVVVVGGGATGVETAAEIKTAFPNKTVRLVHSKPRLLSAERTVSDAKAATAAATLRELGVVVELDRVFGPHDAEPNALVIHAGRSAPNTTFVPNEVLDDKGLVRVTATLAVVGQPNVFALGDCVSGHAPNLKVAAFQHPPVVVQNVLALSKGQAASAVVKAIPGMIDGMAVVTLGPSRAPITAGLVGGMMGGTKRKDMLLAMRVKAWSK